MESKLLKRLHKNSIYHVVHKLKDLLGQFTIKYTARFICYSHLYLQKSVE